MNKKIIPPLFLFFIFIGLSLSSASQAELTGAPINSSRVKITSTGQVTNGTIEGTNIHFSYGTRTFTESGNFTALDEGEVHDSIREERIENIRYPLIDPASFAITDIKFRVKETVTSTDKNSSAIKYFFNNSDPNIWDRINIFQNNSLGFNITYSNDAYDTTEATMMLREGLNKEFLGNFLLNVTYAEVTYKHPNISLLDFNFTWIIYPEIVFVSVNRTAPQDLTLNVTLQADNILKYYSYYSVEYNVEVEEWYANIRDGNRNALQVSAFKWMHLNYTEIRHSVLWYGMNVLANVTLTNSTGYEVPFEAMPFSLRPAYYSTSGQITELDVSHVDLNAISTTNTILQAFHARYQKNLDDVSVTAQSFVAWMIRSTPRLIVYKDGNLDNELNLEFTPEEGLRPTDGDVIPFVGVAEAYRGNVFHLARSNNTFSEYSVSFSGFQPVETNITNAQKIFNSETQYTLGLGIVPNRNSLGFSQVGYWNTPDVNDTTNVVTFNFGVEYNNFPVTWFNATASSESDYVVLPQYFKYDYVYIIDPVNGKSELSPTITYGELQNPDAKAAVSGLSLATIYRSDYMSLFGIKGQRTKDAKENLTSSRTGRFTEISFAGPDNDFSTIDHRGKKQWYTLDGATHQTNVSVLNLFGVSASAVGGNVTVFESQNDNIAGSAYLETTSVAKLDFKYRKDLILVSYPAWDGKEIVHDPSYSTAYVSSPQEPDTTESSSSSVGIQTSNTETMTGAPGFEIGSLIFSIFTVGVIVSIKRRK